MTWQPPFSSHWKARYKRQWPLRDKEQRRRALLLPWLPPLREFTACSTRCKCRCSAAGSLVWEDSQVSRETRGAGGHRRSQSTEQERAAQTNNCKDKYVSKHWLVYVLYMRKPPEVRSKNNERILEGTGPSTYPR